MIHSESPTTWGQRLKWVLFSGIAGMALFQGFFYLLGLKERRRLDQPASVEQNQIVQVWFRGGIPQQLRGTELGNQFEEFRHRAVADKLLTVGEYEEYDALVDKVVQDATIKTLEQ